jgi:hypothetical protein
MYRFNEFLYENESVNLLTRNAALTIWSLETGECRQHGLYFLSL